MTYVGSSMIQQHNERNAISFYRLHREMKDVMKTNDEYRERSLFLYTSV